MQTCVTLALAVGSVLVPPVADTRLRQWLLSYVALLQQLQLHIVVARVIGACSDDYVRSLNKRSTTVSLPLA